MTMGNLGKEHSRQRGQQMESLRQERRPVSLVALGKRGRTVTLGPGHVRHAREVGFHYNCHGEPLEGSTDRM